ncbi:MAG: hypothetical protein A2271_01050 [Candidatus Moranbacteria bacterium RIFOXYA12_FULL_35_19]|nr:MAG: hypothetical protein UR78_C0005G0028 [Candidatus Moranbacteria bacterium GW2011_GWF2_35_39]OGI32598.1 MAG: hypothetical protein A2489_02725 [Candidatus Moranbacteria bacterium RIFOXYC12_FULL_36_13]OGI36487.1 MAG: hypothetical protein A2271_01050 [Candidatus Moranbacteria bacterium RIFOXYA12_FULL_35_19]
MSDKQNKKNNNVFSRRGFTLLELMASIAIIGIMTGVGLASLSSAKRHYALKTAQEEVTSAIKLAQSYALQGRGVAGVEKVCGYRFVFTNSSTYAIYYYTMSGQNCTGSINIDNLTQVVETQTLKNGVTLFSPTTLSRTRIFFSIPNARVFSGTFPKTFTFDSGGEKKGITISSTGLVSK